MSYAEDIVYRYDGTFDGFLCCVFESYAKKEIPAAIFSVNEGQFTIYPEKNIETVLENAQRVYKSFDVKMGKEARELIRYAFLTCMEEKELTMYRFIRLGYQYGNKVMNMLTDDTVNKMFKAVHYLKKEAHLFTGFVRFSETEDFLAAQIEPNNFVLPILAEHFTDRYKEEKFVIYDKTHKTALFYSDYKISVVEMESFEIPKTDCLYEELWKRYYKSIAIEERYNPRCRMTMMPKRYWKNIFEVKDEL